MKNVTQLFFILLLITSCSNDDLIMTELTVADFSTTKNITCSVPFIDDTNRPPTFTVSSERIIKVGGTSPITLPNAVNMINSMSNDLKALYFEAGTYNIPVFRRASDGSATNRTILAFNEIENLEIYGAPGAIIQFDLTPEDSYPALAEVRDNQVALLTILSSTNIYVH